jgi:hypothetical protein
VSTMIAVELFQDRDILARRCSVLHSLAKTVLLDWRPS